MITLNWNLHDAANGTNFSFPKITMVVGYVIFIWGSGYFRLVTHAISDILRSKPEHKGADVFRPRIISCGSSCNGLDGRLFGPDFI